MKKNMKKFLVLSVLSMFVFMFALQVVSAAESKDATTFKWGDWTVSKNKEPVGIHAPVEEPTWLAKTIKFFGFGKTWADFIVALAIVLMVFAATFDVLNLTAFSTGWVKYLISIGVAAAFGVSGGVGAFAVWMVLFTGGSVMIATFVVIVMGAGLLIFGTFLKGKMMKLKSRQEAGQVRGAMALHGAKVAGDIATAKAAIKASKAKTP